MAIRAEMENKELLFSYFVKNGVARGERGYGSTSKVGIARSVIA